MTLLQRPRVAFVDDEKDLVASLKAEYSKDYEVTTFESPQEALRHIDDTVAVVVADHLMPGMTGVELLAKVRAKSPSTIRVLLTAAMEMVPFLELINEANAFRCIPKDINGLDHLKIAVAEAVAAYCKEREKTRTLATLERQNIQLNALLKVHTNDERSFEDLLGNDPQLQAAINQARSVADTDLTVLITGESGTGKEDLARAIHFQGKRNKHPFKKENCSMYSRELLQARLFGTVDGAFTGAKETKGILREADGGTVFLDEIGEMELEVQTFFLAFLDGGDIHPVGPSGPKNLKANVRIVAATNKHLPSAVNTGQFRLDLFHRISETAIQLPPLRDRRADIPLLARRAVIVAARRLGMDNAPIGPSVIEYLQSLPYPGNVRELFNIIKRAMASMQTDGAKTIELEYVCAAAEMGKGPPMRSGSFDEAVDAFKKQYIEGVLRRHRTLRAAAEELGVDVRTLLNWREKFGISKEE